MPTAMTTTMTTTTAAEVVDGAVERERTQRPAKPRQRMSPQVLASHDRVLVAPRFRLPPRVVQLGTGPAVLREQLGHFFAGRP